jgi:hypothetical protein
MRHRSAAESLFLPAGRLESFVFDKPMRVRITRGCVWLTVSRMKEDHWLTEGDMIDVPAHRQVVVEAHKVDSQLGFIDRQQEAGQLLSCESRICVES